jgi:Holliday junction DNA helicase RuvA
MAAPVHARTLVAAVGSFKLRRNLSLAPDRIVCLRQRMIAFVRGKLAESLPNQVTVDVNGVGYHAFIPLSTFDRLPQPGAEVRLLTHYHVTDRDHTLFGFLTSEERDLFRLLIDRVSGIGPKLALAVLSGMPVTDFKDAVIRSDIAALSRMKGVGKKTAERIVLELQDKVGVVETWQAARSAKADHDPSRQAQTDAVLGLIALGFKQTEAQKAITELIKQPGFESATTPDKLIRDALRVLNF